MYKIYFHPDFFSVFQWKITETGFTAQNVNKNVLLFALKELFKNFVGELIFVTSIHMWVEVERFTNREYNSFFLNYWKKKKKIYNFLWIPW